jgi:hypothetical protein
MVDSEHIKVFRFLNDKIYKKGAHCRDIKGLLKNPVSITRKIIDRSENWENFIISPKLDGERGLFVILSNVIYIVQESRLLKIVELSESLGTFVFESEILQNVIYLYDIHYSNQSILHLKYFDRLIIMEQSESLISSKAMRHTQYTLVCK